MADAPDAQPPGAAESPSSVPPPMRTLTTGCGPLDRLLDGGLETDAVTLVFGESASGKTNLALQCSREALSLGRRVAYVDSEGVSPQRLQQVLGEQESAAERLLNVFTPFDLEQQDRAVAQATKLPDLGLVVVDSINAHYRLFLDGDERAAQRSLLKQLSHLTQFARRLGVPVLVTGQVYGDEDTTQPFAQRTMSHLVKASVRFERQDEHGVRKATLVKHRSLPEGRRARFRIGAHGLEGPGGEGSPAARAGHDATDAHDDGPFRTADRHDHEAPAAGDESEADDEPEQPPAADPSW
ncbi:MAG: DNA repair and recombination protein RadB [Thermoplasmatota archaeon]